MVAQQDPCPAGNCTISCLNSSDPWTTGSGTSAGTLEWLIVHAKPKNITSGAFVRWKDPDGPTWPKLIVVGHWKAADNSTIDVTVTVDDDGACDESGDTNDRVRCHDSVGSDPDYLCDSFSGNWKRVTESASGAGASCLKEVIYGFDFQKTFTQDGKLFCFQTATVTPVQTNGLYGRNVNPSTPCLGDNLIWNRVQGPATWNCGTTEDPRPGGDDLIELDAIYEYRQP